MQKYTHTRARARTYTLLREPAMLPRVCEPAFVSPRRASCSLRRTVTQVQCSLIGLQNAPQPQPLRPPIHHAPRVTAATAVLAAETHCFELERCNPALETQGFPPLCRMPLLESLSWTGGAPINYAPSLHNMRDATATSSLKKLPALTPVRATAICSSNCLAASNAALFCRPAVMSVSKSSLNSGTLASVARTKPDGTMVRATAACPSNFLAASKVARCCAATAMLAAQSSFCQYGSTAGIQSAELKGSMLRAETIFPSTRNAPTNRAEPVRGVRIAAKPSCLKDVAAAWSRSRNA